MINEEFTMTIEPTLQGDLVTISNKHNKIVALVNLNNWFTFRKIKLLHADGLNYEWAKEQVLIFYTKSRDN